MNYKLGFFEKCIIALGVLLLLMLIIPMISALAQATNAPASSITIPSFTIPIPAQWAAWIGAHGLLLWLGIRAAIKFLDGFQVGRPWVATIVNILEHISFNKSVATVAQKVAGSDVPPADVAQTAAANKAAIEGQTDNGLLPGSPEATPPPGGWPKVADPVHQVAPL